MNMKVLRVRMFFSCTLLIIIIFFLKNIQKPGEYNDYIIKRPHDFQTVGYLAKKAMRKNFKVINLWTEYDHDHFEYRNLVEKHLQICPFRCFVTDNPKLLMDSDAVLFHLTDIWIPNWNIGTKRTIQFPSEADPNQVWIIHNSEPPFYLFGDTNIFEGIFNWTMWYRSDATIFDPYGRYQSLDEVKKKEVHTRYGKRNIYSEKSMFMAGAISNCKDPARRYLLIDEMSKYLDIEMFGKCYGKMCGTAWTYDDKDCHVKLKKYRFYLAFESNQCKDYITEKYWNALDRDQIPVVNWKHKDILSGYVPNSYINVYDFSSIKDVADYIKIVNRNETLYNSYFEWRNNFSIDLTRQRAWCDVCKKLHSVDENYLSETVDFKKFIDSDVCHTTTKEIHDAELTARANFLAWKAAG